MSSPVATVLIPYADYHKHLVDRAIDSAVWQTVDCDVIALESPNTPAIVRNMSVKTPFVIFLDADDMLHPTFTEECLRVYERGFYVYTNWTEGNLERRPCECPFLNGSYHIVTTLYPADILQAIGGFDEALPGGEDVDFYLKSASRGICGIYLNKALVARPDDSGLRSKQYVELDIHDEILHQIVIKHGGVNNIMKCCGGVGSPAGNNPGVQMPGDVLVQTLWAGMHSENGHATGRMYIGGNGNQIWVSPDDLAAMPSFFRQVQDLSKIAPDKQTVLRTAGLT